MTDITRREFVQAGISAGFAVAATPIASWAITTPLTGLVAEAVKVPTDGGSMPAYWARPQGKGPFATVLVIQEIFGVHEHIQDICRRLAKEGYLAIAPALYFRHADTSKMTDKAQIMEVVGRVPQTQVLVDLDATVAWLVKSAFANVSRLGITGFCWGGNVTWMYCAHDAEKKGPKVKAGVAWYGRLVGQPTPTMPKYPVDFAGDLKVPVLGLYGAKDTGIPLETVEQMRVKLAGGKSGSEIVVYPEAEHAFFADYRPSYHEESAKDAWGKMLQWFKKHGVS